MTWPPPPSDGTSENGPDAPRESAPSNETPGPAPEPAYPAPPPPPPPGPPPPPPPPPPTFPPPPPPGVPPAYPGGETYATQPGQYTTGYPAAVAPASRTNTMAIVSLILSLAGIATLITAPVGAVLGHIARRQIRETGEEGDGMALAGIVVGWIITGLIVLACCAGLGFFVIAASTTTVN